MKSILFIILLGSLLILLLMPKKTNQRPTTFSPDLDLDPIDPRPSPPLDTASIEFIEDERQGAETKQEPVFFDLTFYRKTVQNCVHSLFSPYQHPPDHPVYPPLNPGLEEAILNQAKKMQEIKQGYTLMQVIDDPNSSLQHISGLIIKDPVLSAQVLRVSNSAFFGLKNEVQSIHHAIMLIGLLNLKKLITYQMLFKDLATRNDQEQTIYLSLWEHVSLTSLLANYLAQAMEGISPGTMFTMGLLHDIGKFIISQLAHDYVFKKSTLIPYFDTISLQEEIEVFGVSHPQVGKFCCQIWGLPQGITILVGQHHSLIYPPGEVLKEHAGLKHYLVGVHVANCLANLILKKEKDLPLPIHPDFQQVADPKQIINTLSDSGIFSEILKSQAINKESCKASG